MQPPGKYIIPHHPATISGLIAIARLSARFVVAVALIASAYLHLLNPYQFLDSILAYRFFPPALAALVAAILPPLQLTLGLAIIFLPAYQRAALFLSAFLFALFLAAQLLAVSRGLAISCGCFGSSGVPIGWRSIGLAGGCLMLSLAALIRRKSTPLPPRNGFTLIELLVVLAILSVLAGLVLSAVQRARSSTLRIDCQNRLRQVALALHQHHLLHHTLPPGLSVEADQGKYPYLGWTARMLPFLEQDSLWRDIEQAFATDPAPRVFYGHPPHAKILSSPVRMYNCPADPRLTGFASRIDMKAAFTSYLGVEGLNPYRRDGVLFADSRIAFSQITDGQSSTLMLGERPPSANLRLGWWYRGWGQIQDGSAEMLLGVRERNESDAGCPFILHEFAAGRLDNTCDAYHFWSTHLGGANFAFADGSVRFLHYSSNPIMPALASRDGGENADLP